MTLDAARIADIRRDPHPVVLYLDVSDEAYVKAWHEDIPDVWVVDADLSAMILGLLFSGRSHGGAADLYDAASRGVSLFLTAGLNRQAFLAPLMEALAMSTHAGVGGPEDPLHGYNDRVTAENTTDG